MSFQGAVILDEQDSSVVFKGQWDHVSTSGKYIVPNLRIKHILIYSF